MLITHSISENFSCMDILHSLSLSRAKNSCHALDPITNSMHHNFLRDCLFKRRWGHWTSVFPLIHSTLQSLFFNVGEAMEPPFSLSHTALYNHSFLMWVKPWNPHFPPHTQHFFPQAAWTLTWRGRWEHPVVWPEWLEQRHRLQSWQTHPESLQASNQHQN